MDKFNRHIKLSKVGQSPTPPIPILIPTPIRTHTTSIVYRNIHMTGRRMGMSMDIPLLMLASILPSGHTNTYAIVSLISVNLLSHMPMPNLNHNSQLHIVNHHQSSVKFSLFNLLVSTFE